MTRVYLCWSNREPEFQKLLPDTHLLISPALLTKQWTVESWNTLPATVMVDSGAFTESKKKGIFNVRTCLQAQLRVLQGWPPDREAILVHYDKPLHPDLPFDQYQARVSQNLSAAKEYLDLFPRKERLTPMAVMHALDGETLAMSYLELQSMGYNRFAIGSLVKLLYCSRPQLQALLKICRDIGMDGLHVLGIASPSLLKPEIGPWIGSFDTSAPVRQAIGGTIFYSKPFERFVLRPTGTQKLGNRSYGSRAPLDLPRPCACPVCTKDPHALLSKSEVDARQHRKIHNAFHLLEEVSSWAPYAT